MGGGSSSDKPPQIIYKDKIVDKTNEIRAQAEAKLRVQQEQQRLAQEKADAVHAAEHQAKLELVAAIRAKLVNYTLGAISHPNIYAGLDVSDVKRLRIACFGPTGSGKSCFINTCERTLSQQGRGTCNPQHLGQEGTIILEDFLQGFFFNLVDTRGFFLYDDDENSEFEYILNGQIRTCEEIKRGDGVQQYHQQASQLQIPFQDCIHAAILIIKANDPRLQNDSFAAYMRHPRERLRSQGITAVTLITHADTLENDEAREQARIAASRATGAPANQTFFITNYTVDDCEVNFDTEMQALTVLQYALQSAERFVKITKQRSLYGGNAPAPAANSAPPVQEAPSAPPVADTNFGITVVSKLEGDNNKSIPYEITCQYTCQTLLETIKPRFKLGSLHQYYLASPSGCELALSANVAQALRGGNVIHLWSY